MNQFPHINQYPIRPCNGRFFFIGVADGNTVRSDRQPIRLTSYDYSRPGAEPDQKTFRDYNLPETDLHPASERAPAPALLDRVDTTEAAARQITAAVLGAKTRLKIKTPLKPVVIHRRQLIHLTSKDLHRQRFGGFVVPTLTDPNEVWLTAYSDGFRRRFIKLFKGPTSNMLVIARENKDDSLFWNAFTADSNYIDRQRTGVLLYRR